MATRRRLALAGGLVAFGISGFAYAQFRRDIFQARARVFVGSTVAQTACGPIEYAAAGCGPPMLIVHGAGGGYDQGMQIGEAFANQFQVIAMSRFGYLRTPMPADASASAQADAHAHLLDVLRVERATIVGISAGAPSAMQFALRHPERTAALVLISPAAYAPRPKGAPAVLMTPLIQVLSQTALRSDFLFWVTAKLARNTVTRSILGTPPQAVHKAGASERARVQNIIELILPVTARRRGLLNDSAITSSLPRYELEQIRAPTLAVACSDDLYGTYDGARYSAQHIPGATFIGYSRGGHVWVGHHSEVVALISDFVRSASVGA